MTDHANELRRHAGKIGRPAGDVTAVMHAAAAYIEDLERRLREAEKDAARLNFLESKYTSKVVSRAARSAKNLDRL